MHNKTRPPWVTIVSGLPRSGTSMMMQMLAAGGLEPLVDGVRVADEDNQRGYYEYEPVKRTREDSSWVGGAVGKVVKMVYLLLYDLPVEFEYRVVLMERPLDEVLASQQIMLERRGQSGANLSGESLADLFRRQRSKVDQWLAGQPTFRVLTVDYHAVLAGGRQESDRISAFLDGTLDATAMASAIEPTMRRHRS